MATGTTERRKRGRPRKFDEDAAIDAAMQVFWEKGYEGASLRDLTKAMGIDRKSMYMTMGDKETLFLKALDRYSATHMAFLPVALAKPTLREFVDEFLNAAIRFWTDKSHPPACISIQNIAVSDEAQPVKQAMVDWREWALEQLRKRAEKARKEDDLPPEVSPATFARYFAVVMNGLAMQAANGATLRDLKRVVALVRRTIPVRANPAGTVTRLDKAVGNSHPNSE